MKKTYNSEYEKLFSRYAPYQGSEYSVDTLSYELNEDASVELPGQIGMGMAFGKKDLFLITADYTMTYWDQVSFHGYGEYLVLCSKGLEKCRLPAPRRTFR